MTSATLYSPVSTLTRCTSTVRTDDRTNVGFLSEEIPRPFRANGFITVRHQDLDMSTKATPASAVDGEPEVMASVDDDGAETRLIIADTSTDDAWIAMAIEDAVALSERC